MYALVYEYNNFSLILLGTWDYNCSVKWRRWVIFIYLKYLLKITDDYTFKIAFVITFGLSITNVNIEIIISALLE